MEIGTTEYTRLKSLETVAERLVEENTELKAQIEKMKHCAICKYDTLYASDEPCKSCIKKNHWELGE